MVTAKEIFQDTAFGYFTRLLTGGRFLGWEDQQDPNTLDRYLSTLSKVSTHASQQQQREPESSDPEKDSDGSPSPDVEKSDVDFELIDWVEGDIKVRDSAPASAVSSRSYADVPFRIQEIGPWARSSSSHFSYVS